MKRIITTSLLIGFMTINFTPVFAVNETNAQTQPKQFKSMMKTKKNKKTNPSYRYDYINQKWWNNFNDEILNNYINRAIENNYDLKMATLAVEEYYQQTRLAFSKELPSAGVGFAPNYVKLPGSDAGSLFALPALVQYEADIFLKNHDKTKSVKKLWEGSKLDERSAYISVVSAVGATYLNIVKLDKIIEIQEDIVRDRKMIFELMLMRNQEGITSTADTVRANKSYIAGNLELIELKKQREQLLNQMCVLIGESPEHANNLKRTTFDKLNFQGEIPSEITSDIIVQRPDYLKAEKMVEKAGIDVRVARKEFLPTINLNGLAIFNTTNLGSLFTTSNMISGLGGAILWPVFTGGARVYNLRLKKATYERILNNYYKTNLTAIQEVNDSLVSIRRDEEKLKETQLQKQLENEDFGYSEDKFEQGIISKLDLIQVKENLLVTDRVLTVNKINCYIDYIGLYKAVGSKL